jgi:dTDP-4-dehydrorhamnose 3,5-epimerase
MDLIETPIEDLLILQPNIFEDERGYFFELYNKNKFKEFGLLTEFIQDNESKSIKGIVRGLHLQLPPYEQAKLIRVVSGSILDVAVDLRVDSKTYGKYYSIIISEKNKTMFYIPEGFAHGFLSLENNTITQYKCSNVYSKPHEVGIMWDDKDINIDWGIKYTPILSDKDKKNIKFKDFKKNKLYE